MSSETLQILFAQIDEVEQSKKQDLQKRNNLVYEALGEATKIGIKCGISLDSDAPHWPIVVFELPTGQVVWHIATIDLKYVRHTEEENRCRLGEYLYGVAYTKVNKYASQIGHQVKIQIMDKISLERYPPAYKTIFQVSLGDIKLEGTVSSHAEKDIKIEAHALMYANLIMAGKIPDSSM